MLQTAGHKLTFNNLDEKSSEKILCDYFWSLSVGPVKLNQISSTLSNTQHKHINHCKQQYTLSVPSLISPNFKIAKPCHISLKVQRIWRWTCTHKWLHLPLLYLCNKVNCRRQHTTPLSSAIHNPTVQFTLNRPFNSQQICCRGFPDWWRDPARLQGISWHPRLNGRATPGWHYQPDWITKPLVQVLAIEPADGRKVLSSVAQTSCNSQQRCIKKWCPSYMVGELR